MKTKLNPRRKKILKKIIEEYIKKAKPISSGMLVKKDFSKLSSATLRNEMLELVEEGLLFQPHISAGKVPTLNGFRFFLDNFLEEKEVNKKEMTVLLKIKEGKRKKIKELAEGLAEMTGEVIVVGFSKDDYFYTGLSRLFSQPEFEDFSLIRDLTEGIDHLDKVMGGFFNQIGETKILLGDENPFGDRCAAIINRVEIDNQKIMFGLLGPIRMDYNKSLVLIKTIKQIFE